MAKILIAEDNVDNRDILVEFLCGEGYDVVEAANGADAVKMAREQKPDVILMDLQMPDTAGVDATNDDAGLDATRALRAEPTTAAIPVVALSGHDAASRQRAITQAGCNAVAAKPYDFGELLSLIERLVKAP